MGTSKEVQVSKSPAEFFSENQAIAGFDNMGKSLYTTIRELVENALDACESVGVLPSISIAIEEMTQERFNEVRGLNSPVKRRQNTDPDNAGSTGKPMTTNNTKRNSKSSSTDKKGTPKGKRGNKRDQEGYFRIIVRDNGCGMAHNAIPDLLGRVLSGSKYGVRQTRGKFGLGAKMALIWSKKSTGVPIRVKTSHMKARGVPGGHVSKCVLDIDINKNCPRIIEHKKAANTEQWVGTEFEVLIAGNWTTKKSYIMAYFQQLAVITPYAQFEMTYHNEADPKKHIVVRYDRRSEQMPPAAKEVPYHPSSVNNIIVQQLIERTKATSLAGFLTKDFSCTSPSLAKKFIAEVGGRLTEQTAPSSMTDKEVTKLVQHLRSTDLFKTPDGSCLSPLGEYNLNLGIQKVIEPEMVATARDKASSYDGHPFIVEAGVSIGGKGAKEGVTVFRFSNRIPLLFEGGADVATRVAQSKIKWSSYKIDHKRDKIGVFVSIVSTKIPFKGTGKEYIGDDITEIQLSVKRALQSCCQQLRTRLTKKYALKDIRERRSRLTKYVPDVCRSLHGIIDQMKRRYDGDGNDGIASTANGLRHSKRSRLDDTLTDLTEKDIRTSLLEAIDDENNGIEETTDTTKKKEEEEATPLFLVAVKDPPETEPVWNSQHFALFLQQPAIEAARII